MVFNPFEKKSASDLINPLKLDRFHCSENYRFTQKVITPWEELRPKIENFGDAGMELVGEVERQRDLEDIRRIKESPSYIHQRTEAAIVAEYLVPQIIEDEMVLGDEEINIGMASEYDDIFSGIDIYFGVQYDDEPDRQFVAIDIKTNEGGSRENVYVQQAIKKNVDRHRFGNLPELKYFIDPSDGSQRVNVPMLRFVLVLDKDYVVKLRDICVKKRSERSVNDLQELRKFRRVFLERILLECADILIQLKAYEISASGTKKDKIQTIILAYSKFQKYLRELKKRVIG